MADPFETGNPLAHGKDWARIHDALRARDDIWSLLAFGGIQGGAEPGELFELRHCPGCGSTILRPVKESDALKLVQATLASATQAITTVTERA